MAKVLPMPDLVEAMSKLSPSVPGSLESLFRLAHDVLKRNISGDFVECGVRDGGSAGILAGALRSSKNRKLWLYDSFQGLPAPSIFDGEEAKKYEGKAKGSVESVWQSMETAGMPKDRVVLREGWFKDTFKQPIPSDIALLHIDCDWHNSVLLTLEYLYPKMRWGGVVILDDFGYWEGCRRAFYYFIKEKDIMPLVGRYGHSALWWQVGKWHNRDTH